MTIRTRMTLWYSAVLLLTIGLIAVLSLDELNERENRSHRVSQGMEEIVGIVLSIGVPAAVLSVAGGWWLMRKAFAPVAKLTEAAQQVNERNLSRELPRTRNGDELDRLTEVLNGMTARLNDSFTRVRDFTLHASHELKTPLTILCGETETELREENLSPAARERAVSRLDELRRLARIVDGLTLLAKADAGLVSLKMVPLHLDELVQDCFADTQILAQASGLTVKLVNSDKATVRGDAHRLRQLLLNLADNAVKYNQPGGSISMSLRRINGTAEIKISNTGAGIPPDALPRVFDRFFRADPAHSHEMESCGLGLSISQWIVSVHNGKIDIQSMPRELTTVNVFLPLEEGIQKA